MSAALNDNLPQSRLLLSNLPPDEPLKPKSKAEKDDSEHEPTEHIEGTSERKPVENVRQRCTNECSDVEVPSDVHTGTSNGSVLILH